MFTLYPQAVVLRRHYTLGLLFARFRSRQKGYQDEQWSATTVPVLQQLSGG